MHVMLVATQRACHHLAARLNVYRVICIMIQVTVTRNAGIVLDSIICSIPTG